MHYFSALPCVQAILPCQPLCLPKPLVHIVHIGPEGVHACMCVCMFTCACGPTVMFQRTRPVSMCPELEGWPGVRAKKTEVVI